MISDADRLNTGRTYNVRVAKTSTKINGFALPELIHAALRAQSAQVHTVTGATFTTRTFRATLAGVIHQLAATASSSTTTVTSKVHNVLIPVGCSGPCNFPGTPPRYGVLELSVTGHA